MPGFFTPGTPLYTEESGEILKGLRKLDAAKRFTCKPMWATTTGRMVHMPTTQGGRRLLCTAGDDGTPVDRGKPVLIAKYTGLRALRHSYESRCINRKVDGGLELPAKMVQERLGHANIAMTLDTYGHLFPRGDDGMELAEAELRLIG